MRKYLDLSTWIILFALLPVSTLAFLSQNAVPGDLFYPVKRGLENVVLVASSVHPATKVAFRTDLTEQRFKEAENLLVIQGQTTALTDFVAEFQIIEEELAQISSLEDKQELSDKLIAKIDGYETKLAAVQTQIEQQPVQSEPLPTSFQQAPPPQESTSSTPAPVGQTASPTPFVPTTQQTPQPVDQTPPSTQSPVISLPSEPQKSPIPILDQVKKEETITSIEKGREFLQEVKERTQRVREDAEVEKKFREEAKEYRKNLERGRSEDGDDD